VKERQMAHRAVLTENQGSQTEWETPDGRAGFIRRDGQRVILLETDSRDARHSAQSGLRQITFAKAPEEEARAAANSPLRRFNPLWSWQKDGDYAVARAVGGLLSRHDRNSVGAADSFLLGMVAESRRTASFKKWELGGGFLAKHESEARRGVTKTTCLPWGALASHCAARLPSSPGNIIARTSVLWGAGASVTTDQAGGRLVELLPFGLLLRHRTEPGQSSFYVLGTGLSGKALENGSLATQRVRLLGITVWRRQANAPKSGSRGHSSAPNRLPP
jgi:hypothetical protein